MQIETIHINSFGMLRDRTITLAPGVNVIEGANETGKSSLAAFLKFIFYGLSGRTPSGDTVTPRERYINWETGAASGYVELSCGDGEKYRVERDLRRLTKGDGSDDGVRDDVRIIDLATGEKLRLSEGAGMFFFGVGEDVFTNTAFIGQKLGAAVNTDEISASVENIMLAADETVNVDKALKRLDAARKDILHKNSSGGRLYEIKRRRDSLAVELSDARAVGDSIIEAEAAHDEALRLVSEKEEKLRSLTSVIEAYNAIDAKRKCDEIVRAESEIADADERLDTLAKSGVDRGSIAYLAKLNNDITAYTSEVSLRGERYASLENEAAQLTHTQDNSGADEDINRVNRLGKSRKSVFIWFIVTVVLASFAVAAVFLLPQLDKTVKISICAGNIALYAVSVALFIAYFVKGTKMNRIMAKWDAADSDEMAESIKKSRDDDEHLLELTAELDKCRAELDAAEAERQRVVSEAFDASYRLDVTETDDAAAALDEATAKAEAICADIDAVQSQKSAAEARLSVLDRSMLDDKDEIDKKYASAIATDEGKQALTLDGAAIKNLIRESGFQRETLNVTQVRCRELETKLIKLRAGAVTPAAIAAEISVLDDEIAALSARHLAYIKAYETITAASDSLRRTVVPRIVKGAEQYLSEVTDGRYSKLGSGSSLDMTYTHDGATRDVTLLSSGTSDALYISLRLSLMRVLYRRTLPPAIFDESFARMDETRLARVLGLLMSDGTQQSLIFTCRALEGSMADGAAHIMMTRDAI